MVGVDEDTYRAIMSRLVSGVSVVSTQYRNLDLAMTATSIVSVCLDPPTVLFTVHEDARLAQAIQDGAGWAVNILGADAQASADWLASPGRPAINQLATISYTRGEKTQAAILTQAASWVECETTWMKPAGTHIVVVGRVVNGGIHQTVSGGLVHAFGRIEPY